MSSIDQNTRFINTETSRFGLSLEDIKAANRNVIFGVEVDEELIASLNYAIVVPTDRPVNDIVREAAPIQVEGVWTQQWTDRAYTPEEVASILSQHASEKLAAINQLREACLYIGVPHNFGTEEAPQVYHIQVRDEDRTNHTGILAYRNLNPEMVQVFRPYENVQLNVPAAEIDRMVTSAYTGYMRYMHYFWELKDAVAMAEAPNELPDVPANAAAVFAEFGWTFPIAPGA